MQLLSSALGELQGFLKKNTTRRVEIFFPKLCTNLAREAGAYLCIRFLLIFQMDYYRIPNENYKRVYPLIY